MWGAGTLVAWLLWPNPVVVAAPADSVVLVAQGAAPQAPGSGDSMWGRIPPPTAAPTAALRTRPNPWWFYPVRVPYYVAVWPLGVVFDAVGAGVVVLDDNGVTTTLAGLLDPPSTRLRVGGSIQFSGLEGFGAGLQVVDTRFFGLGNTAEVKAATTTGGKSKLTVGTSLFLSDRSELQLGAGFRRRSRARYFGIGPDQDDAPESFFKQTTTWRGVGYNRRLGGQVFGGVHALFTTIQAEEPRTRDAEQSISTIYPEDVAGSDFGFNRRSEGVSLGVSLIHDTTTETGRPQGGGRYALLGERFEATDGSRLGYFSGHVTLERFIPLWAPYRVLAVKGFWGGILGSKQVPFQRLYTNDKPDELRGYHSFRWRDRSLAGVSTEFRWPIWSGENTSGPGLDAVLLADVGQVFGGVDEPAWDSLALSFGFGLRLIGAGAHLARFEVAFSEEETGVQFRFDQVFQHDRDGLLHGRNPVPAR